MSKRIGVGIIGAGPEKNWAAEAHIPALMALPNFEFRALSTSRRETAMAASEKFGVPLAFDNHHELVNAPGVDLVVVAVKVPHHLELVRAAVAAGKHVFCEWPLGNGLAEALEMEKLVRNAGLFNFIGLQSRAAPEIVYLRDLVRAGYIGELYSATLIGAGMFWGDVVPSHKAYVADRNTGATMLTITFGHAADTFAWVLGEFAELSATLGHMRKSSTVIDTGETIPMTAADQVAVSGTLQNGAVVAMQYRGGMPRGVKLLLEINGSKGDLRLAGDGGHPGMFKLELNGGQGSENELLPLEVPQEYREKAKGLPSGDPRNVALTYVGIGEDFERGTQHSPSFSDAVLRHRLIDAIERGAETRQSQRYVV